MVISYAHLCCTTQIISLLVAVIYRKLWSVYSKKIVLTLSGTKYSSFHGFKLNTNLLPGEHSCSHKGGRFECDQSRVVCHKQIHRPNHEWPSHASLDS